MKNFFGKTLLIGITLVALFHSSGCRRASLSTETEVIIADAPGPPPHAPARGYRGKAYSYVYYPHSRIYFDINRRLYFYFDMGIWKSAAALPSHILLIREGGVTMQMDLDTPYLRIHEHQRRYPPGLYRRRPSLAPGRARGRPGWK